MNTVGNKAGMPCTGRAFRLLLFLQLPFGRSTLDADLKTV